MNPHRITVVKKDFEMSIHDNYHFKKGQKEWSTEWRSIKGWVEEYNVSEHNSNRPAVAVACRGQSACTRLLLETIVEKKEYDKIAYLIILDSSPQEYTVDIARKYFSNHPGYLVHMNSKVSHSEALDIADILGLFKKVKYIQFLDNDVEILRSGLGLRIIKHMRAAKPYADVGGKFLRTRQCKYNGDDSWLAKPVFSTGFVMRRDYWENKHLLDGCALRIDEVNKIYYDTWAYMIQTNPIAKLAAVDYVPKHIKHWGQITCCRGKGYKVPDFVEKRYNGIVERLLQLGIPKNEIHDDRAEPWDERGEDWDAKVAG